MAENKKNQENRKKESIQQHPDQVKDKRKQPVTPEPPQKKDPGAKATSDSKKKK